MFSEILLIIAVTAFLMLPEYVIGIIEILGGLNYWLRVVIALIINLLIVLAVFSQLRGAERYRGRELLVQMGDSNTTVTVESLRQRVQRAVQDLTDIEIVEAEVKGRRGHALISMEVTTSKDEVNIPEKQREIDRVIKQVAVKQMGIKLAEPAIINIRLACDAKDIAAEAGENAPSQKQQPVSPATTPVTASPATGE